MKAGSMIKKNLKLLFRNKGSALVVLLAPLLIVLIIGFSFSGQEEVVLNIGVHAPDNTELTQRFMQNLNTSEIELIEYSSLDDCTSGVEQSVVLACILFPDNFKLETGKTNNVTFYVDESRINLVHQLIAKLSINLDIESSEVTEELTTRLLEILETTSYEVQESIATIVSVKAKSQQAENTRKSSNSQLTNLDVGDVDVETSGLSSELDNLKSDATSLRSKASSAYSDGKELLAKISYNGTEASDLDNSLDSLNSSLSSTSTLDADFDNIIEDLESVDEGVLALKSKLDQTRNVKGAVVDNLNALSADLQKISSDLDSVKSRQEKITSEIGSFDLKNAENIVNPITTNIETVSANKNKVTFSFPYLLMLIVVFVGMMLASTLVFMEKDSRAYFRNFTLPVKSGYFITTTFLTSIIVLLVQILVVLLVVNFGLGVPVFESFGVTGLILLLSMVLFIFAGMFLGHLFSTSEGIMMSSIAIGSVLIFLSNLVLPLETLSPLIQKIAQYNPYVIASESIRKATLFGAGFDSLYMQIVILVVYVILAMAATFIVKTVMSSKYVKNFHHLRNKNKINLPEDHYLVIPEHELVIKNLRDLVIALENIGDKDYAKLISPKNVFSGWLKNNLKARYLALKINVKSREKAIKILKKYLKKKKMI